MTKAEFLVWEEESERLREEALRDYERARTPEGRSAIVEKLAEELNRA